jgi:hypothetical protein
MGKVLFLNPLENKKTWFQFFIKQKGDEISAGEKQDVPGCCWLMFMSCRNYFDFIC